MPVTRSRLVKIVRHNNGERSGPSGRLCRLYQAIAPITGMTGFAGSGGGGGAAAGASIVVVVTASLPMKGAVESLNVSVASGICLYEALRQRERRA